MVYIRLSDEIEKYIKALLAQSPSGEIELQRNSLAVYFRCVPSQINYVLATRFTLQHGFLIESRRGGGGYLRISRLPAGTLEELAREIFEFVGESVSQPDAAAVIKRLETEGLISVRESRLMQAAVSSEVIKESSSGGNRMRAALLKAMVAAVLRR
ncbi:MAG: CtsR family transcriptional regulator [Bacillota bacterium]